jgi:hypothetical protein
MVGDRRQLSFQVCRAIVVVIGLRYSEVAAEQEMLSR